jgi:3-oxoadipate enol-lactonase
VIARFESEFPITSSGISTLVRNMLFKLCMNTIALNLLKVALRAILLIVPKAIKKNGELVSPDKMSHEDGFPDGWQLREVYSEESGLTHRYYFHLGPTPNAPFFLLLHGLFLDGRGFEKMHSLSQRWQLIAYDFPESSTAYRGDMNDFKYLLDDFLDTMKIDDLYLCGVSFGGGIALRYAASHVRRIRALVLVSTFVMNLTRDDRIKSREIAKTLLTCSDGKLQWLIATLIGLSGNSNNIFKSSVVPFLRLKHIDWYKQVLRSITTCEGTEDAQQVKCPVLVLYGTHDKVVSSSHVKLISLHIPQAELQVIEKGTHSMTFLQGSMLAKRICKFCTDNELQSQALVNPALQK